ALRLTLQRARYSAAPCWALTVKQCFTSDAAACWALRGIVLAPLRGTVLGTSLLRAGGCAAPWPRHGSSKRARESRMSLAVQAVRVLRCTVGPGVAAKLCLPFSSCREGRVLGAPAGT